MKTKGMLVAAVTAAVLWLPVFGVAQQTDPTLNPNPTPMNPQSPQNQNVPLNRASDPTLTGAQANQ